VQLDVLARGDVPEAPRELVGDLRHLQQRGAGQGALRQLDAEHVHVRLALAVGPAGQPEGPEGVRAYLPPLVLLQDRDELIDVPLLGEAKLRRGPRK
jgi:hypothetical protein